MNAHGQYDSPLSLPQGSPRSPRVALGDIRRRSESESSNIASGNTSSSASSPLAGGGGRKKGKAKTVHKNYAGWDRSGPDYGGIGIGGDGNGNNNNSSSSGGNLGGGDDPMQRCRGFSQPPIIGSRLVSYNSTVTPCASVNNNNNSNGNSGNNGLGYVAGGDDDYDDVEDDSDSVMTVVPSGTGILSVNTSSSPSNFLGHPQTLTLTSTSPIVATTIQSQSQSQQQQQQQQGLTPSAPSIQQATTTSIEPERKWTIGVNSASTMPTGVIIGDNSNKFLGSAAAMPSQRGGSADNNTNNGAGSGAANSSGGGAPQSSGTWVMGTSVGAPSDVSFTYLPPLNYGSLTFQESAAAAFSQALTALESSRNLLDQLKAYDAPDDFVVECAARLSSSWDTVLKR